MAKSLYMSGNLNQTEIAERVGCARKTLRGWIESGGWEAIRDNRNITRGQLLQEAYRQLQAVNLKINDELDGIPSKETAQVKSSIRKEIEALSDNPLHVYIEVADEFVAWVERNHPGKLMDVTRVFYDFIEAKARENNA